ncbi:MAG: hypothetical protein ACKOI2_12635 [Actinomycetota bacterium]
MTMLLGVMSGTGVARADIVDQDPIEPEDPNAEASAEVTMKERCIWYVSGVASSITLTKDSAETDEVYDGDQFSLSAELEDYIAWTSGNDTGGGSDFDDHAFCTFFGEQTGIDVLGTWSSNEFTATATYGPGDVRPDTNMDFSADGADPMTFDLTEGVCRAEGSWVIGPDIVADLSGMQSSILDLAATAATPRPADSAGSNDKCNAAVLVTASIPEGKTPLYAGKPYTFTGPSFLTEISIDTNR